MEILNKILNSNYFLSYFLFGTSIYLYYHKINYQYIKKITKDKSEDSYKITNTNDSIDYELMLELKKEEEELEKNKYNQEEKYYLDDKFIKKTNTHDNLFDVDFDYFYYCYVQ